MAITIRQSEVRKCRELVCDCEVVAEIFKTYHPTIPLEVFFKSKGRVLGSRRCHSEDEAIQLTREYFDII